MKNVSLLCDVKLAEGVTNFGSTWLKQMNINMVMNVPLWRYFISAERVQKSGLKWLQEVNRILLMSIPLLYDLNQLS
jgi:hypothetical protein